MVNQHMKENQYMKATYDPLQKIVGFDKHTSVQVEPISMNLKLLCDTGL